MYAATFGNAAKYASRISRAWSVGMSRRCAEPVGLHAVREAVVDDLGEAALERRRPSSSSTSNTRRRGGGVDVGAALERVDEARVLGEVREDAQLDLRVVGGEQPAAVVGDERLAQLAPARRCAPGCSAGSAPRYEMRPGRGRELVERRVDAAVGAARAAAARRRRCRAASRPRGSAAASRRSGARRPSSAASRRRSTGRSSSSSPA